MCLLMNGGFWGIFYNLFWLFEIIIIVLYYRLGICILIHFFLKLDGCIILPLASQYACFSPFSNSGNSVSYCRTGILHDHSLKTDLIPTPVIMAIIVNSTDFVFVVILYIDSTANHWFKTMTGYSVCLYPKFILHSKFVYLERVQQKAW